MKNNRKAVAYWKDGINEMKVLVSFDKTSPEEYTIVEALHNGKDVTDFFDYVDGDGEGLFIERITEAIFQEIAEENYTKFMDNKKAA